MRAAELDVDTLVQAAVDLTGEVAQSRGVDVGEVDEVRALDGGVRGEVDVVADEDGGSGRPLFAQAAAAVGEDDRATTQSRCRADVVDDRAHSVALVEVGAGAEDQRATTGVANGDRTHGPRVTCDGGLAEAGTSVFSISVSVSPMRSPVCPQPEPRTSAT